MKQWNVNWEIRQVKQEQLPAFSHYISDNLFKPYSEEIVNVFWCVIK